jgi:hypothetical protein
MLDPVTALSLVLTINDIVSRLYTIGKDLKDGPGELGRLCTELFALQAALNHVAMNMQFASTAQGAFPTALLGTDEFDSIMSTAKTLLEELLHRLQKHGTGMTASLKHRLTWAWSKDDIKDYAARLERMKSYFTLVTTSNNFELSQRLFEEIRSIKTTQDQESRNRLHSDLKQWLGAFDCQQLHEGALAAWQAGTGQWFLQGGFREWNSWRGENHQDGTQHARILWLHGKSGSGKTTMLSAAINENATCSSGSQGPPYAFFYCTFKILSTQEPSSILASFITQLCDQQSDLWELVENDREEKSTNGQRSQKPSLDQLQELLGKISRKFEDVCLFLDAPNESGQSSVILESLGKVMAKHTGLRLCLSSTPDLKIHALTKQSLKCLPVDMEEAGMTADIEAYVRNSLDEHDAFRDLPVELRINIKEGIMSRANGSFRWVDCQLRSLALQDTVAEMEEALDLLSGSLEDHYQSILLAVPNRDRSRAKSMLFWLAFQLRSMNSVELSEAVILKDDMPEAIDGRHRLVRGRIEYFIQICRSLVNYDAEKNIVSLAHSSVKAYLTSLKLEQSKEAAEFYLDEGSVPVILVRRCLQYLLQAPFRSGYCEPRSDRELRYVEWPLFRYCADTWPVYMQMVVDQHVQLDTETRQLLLAFLQTRDLPRGGNFGAWLQRYLPTHVPDRGQEWPISTPLNIAAREGLNAIVELILSIKGKGDLEVPGGSTQSTPLHRACAFGHVEVVKTLLAAGANVHEVNGRGLSGTYWANRFGYSNIVQVMLDAGVDPKYTEKREKPGKNVPVVQRLGYRNPSHQGYTAENLKAEDWTICNACQAPITEEYSHCNICDDGDYDLCRSCVKSGSYCSGHHRPLEKRQWSRGPGTPQSAE